MRGGVVNPQLVIHNRHGRSRKLPHIGVGLMWWDYMPEACVPVGADVVGVVAVVAAADDGAGAAVGDGDGACVAGVAAAVAACVVADITVAMVAVRMCSPIHT